jgi:nitroimidazol reductase NimA-like FMN-containing flavoprotein (pyridoxamine 5'-phosphate oxidase superfamily)
MTTRKPTAKRQSPERTGEPRASRPQIPPEYGIPRSTKGLLPWSHVTERMSKAMHYWVCTVSPNGQPHAMPVDGLWLDDRLYFGGSPQTRRNRNLAANPAVCIHLDGSSDVVMLQGEARLHIPDRAFALRLAEASAQKYGYAPKPEDYEATPVHVFRPHVVFAWTHLMKDATRWEFPNDAA